MISYVLVSFPSQVTSQKDYVVFAVRTPSVKDISQEEGLWELRFCTSGTRLPPTCYHHHRSPHSWYKDQTL